MLSLWANWLVTKFGLNSLKRYLWPVLYLHSRWWLSHVFVKKNVIEEHFGSVNLDVQEWNNNSVRLCLQITASIKRALYIWLWYHFSDNYKISSCALFIKTYTIKVILRTYADLDLYCLSDHALHNFRLICRHVPITFFFVQELQWPVYNVNRVFINLDHG